MRTRLSLLLVLSCLIISMNSLPVKDSQAEGASNDNTFTVGVLLCLTGDCSETGNNSLHGIELARDEINSAGGVLGRKIVLSVQDTREMNAAANAVSAYQKLALDSKIHYVIGPTWSVGGLPLIPIITKRNDLIMTSPSLGIAGFNEAADFLFNTWPHDSYSTEALAKYAIDQGWKKAAVFSNQNPWESTQAKVFVDAYKKLGGTIVAFEEPLGEIQDLKAEALKIKSRNPDVVFMTNYTRLDVATRELERLHYTGAKMSTLIDETRIKNSAGALNGTIYARYPDAAPDFTEKFEKRFGAKPGMSADTAYDTLKIYAKAIEDTKTFDVNTVKKAMLSMQYTGASGKTVFDEKGGVVKHPIFWVIKDSKQVPLVEEKPN